MHSHCGRSRRRQQKLACIFCLTLVILPVEVSFGQGKAGPAVDVSGHLDVRAVEGNTAVKNNDFQIGQFVLDLSSVVNDRMTANMEIAYASEDRDVVVNETYVMVRDSARPRVAYFPAEGSSNDTMLPANRHRLLSGTS